MKALPLILFFLWQTSPLGISTDYDKFTNKTIVRDSQSIMPVRPGFVLFDVVASINGRYAPNAKPTTIAIVITSRSDEWVFLKTTNTFRVLYNETDRYELGQMKRIAGDVVNGGVVETLYLEVSMSDIDKLSKAKKLEIQVGPLESEIKPEQIASIERWLRMFETTK